MASLNGSRPRSRRLLAAFLLSAGVWADPSASPAAEPDPAQRAAPLTGPDLVPAGWQGLAGRIRDDRAALKARGVEFGISYIGEVFGNARGGLRRGAAYEGRLDLQLDADLGTLAGFEGLRFHASAFQNHGTGPSRYYVGSLASVSGIEALPATRLHEAWLEQAFLDRTLSLRAGKLAADAEFLVSPSATVFLNTTFGWPMIAGADLPSGGPATPFATPGLRAKWNPSEATTLLLGLFNGDPAKQRGAAADLEPQRRNRDGLDVSVGGQPLVIAEIARSYVVPGSGQGTGPGSGPERTGTVKLGYMHHFGRFADLRLDSFGVSLAAPWSTGTGRPRRGEDTVYAVLDQTLYREDAESDRGAAAFLRVAASPSPASPVSVYADAGLVYKGLIPGRPDDVAGLSLAYTRIASRARSYDRDLVAFQGFALPVRRAEAVIELTYQAVVAPGFTVQPDIQYIVSPGAHTWNLRLPGYLRIRNSAVFGLRGTILY